MSRAIVATKTSDGAVKDSAGTLLGVVIQPDGTNAASVIIYDNASAASGTKLFQGRVTATASQAVFGIEVPASNGIYVDLTGTGVEIMVYYK